jgi:hypothetical protein
MFKHIKTFISLLIVAAFLSAGISPACAFISGQTSLIEICNEVGEIETIAINAEGEKVPQQKHAHQDQDCTFCFSAAHAKTFVKAQSIPVVLSAGYLRKSSGSAIPVTLSLKAFESTGPPALSSN